jgi:NADP-dependent 3-hydroxy acid dehydrogenase YdfG
MKIAITGHTDGVGKSIYEKLLTEFDVVGLSRSNGYDIKNIDVILEQIEGCDVFINNAFQQNYQTLLFEKLFNKWKFLPKLIINMNSSCVYEPSDWNLFYANSKKDFREVSMNIIRSNVDKRVRVTNLYPSTLSSHIGFESLNKIDIEHVSDIVYWLVTQPVEIEIREMSIYCTTLHKEIKINTLI